MLELRRKAEVATSSTSSLLSFLEVHEMAMRCIVLRHLQSFVTWIAARSKNREAAPAAPAALCSSRHDAAKQARRIKSYLDTASGLEIDTKLSLLNFSLVKDLSN